MSVTAPQGFRAAGVAAGLKPSGNPDVALVVNDGPSDTAAGVFTRNRIQAAPVRWTRQVLADGRLRAVVLNSGGANACTGPAGFADTHATAEHVASPLGIGAGDVAVCSTGLIGVRLDLPALLGGVTAAVSALSGDGGADAAEAIRTTDTVAKMAVRTSGATPGVTVGGMGKGAAMLAPSLATMLVVVTTDAVADAAVLDRVVREASRVSFERVDSDGCLSTNDTVLLLASGASGVALPEAELTELVAEVCTDLAQQMLGDAEGATKTIAITIVGAASETDALEVGRSVARNNLLKCALYGKDPNWGRVLAAIGTTQAAFEPDALDVSMNGVRVCRAGAPGESRDLVDLSGRQVDILVDLHAGSEELTVWTNDLTDGYVYENSAYST
ncbi:bifunctional glutamate N-acetyltransferase/amino-acid acetyltransferase ArgJ [Frankia sp. AgKG'84/4]|uniref:bifunctional glutamate N-acetyltransferase/amino-acid acetyltransferase ArgJ n=1 Tax=Frankia sp. AgKG'84/4 TaxID=573490 RepID=UPI00200F5E8A|nr:bifunctional glutamate N-acetyltransferase/amino-acid acetyltransferase ArgJ [Frankia sp. AgKG'84/4]MCL9794859.1 bifunctional glutamate N-acetyltransferase/amino-acid acetyltransferase ArgJ [Frankia sp. AgKG'84/4]